VPKKSRPERVHRLEVVGDLDAHAAEEFALEIRRLVKRWTREITEVRITAARPDRRGRLA
jgi:hypothetical protein